MTVRVLEQTARTISLLSFSRVTSYGEVIDKWAGRSVRAKRKS
jgi:hypothetical protein